MKTKIILLLVGGMVAFCCLITVVVSVLMILGSVGKDDKEKVSETSGSSISSSSSKEAITKFFDSDSKNGKFSTSGTESDGTASISETGEYWVDGENFRIDYYQPSGEKRISIISKDGIAYFCIDKDQTCTPSVVSVDYYLALYSKPSDNPTSTSEDPENKCTKYYYLVDRTYDMKGSSNKWYNKSISYCVSKDDLVYIETEGGIPDEGSNTTTELDDSIYTYSKTRVGLKIDETIFNLPFEIKDAE